MANVMILLGAKDSEGGNEVCLKVDEHLLTRFLADSAEAFGNKAVHSSTVKSNCKMTNDQRYSEVARRLAKQTGPLILQFSASDQEEVFAQMLADSARVQQLRDALDEQIRINRRLLQKLNSLQDSYCFDFWAADKVLVELRQGRHRVHELQKELREIYCE